MSDAEVQIRDPLGKQTQSIENINPEKLEQEQNGQKKGLPEILKRPTERKYGQEALIEQQQKLRSSQTGRSLVQSEQLQRQLSNISIPDYVDSHILQESNIQQSHHVGGGNYHNDKNNDQKEIDEISQLRKRNQSSIVITKEEQEQLDKDPSLIKRKEKNQKIQTSYTSFAQQVKGGVYPLNRNNYSSYGPRRMVNSHNQIEKLDQNIKMLEQNLQQLKKSQAQVQDTTKLSNSPYKARPITASAEKKIKDDKMEAYNRLYNINENIQEGDHMIVNFNANYYNKKKSTRIGMNNGTNTNFYQKNLLDKKLQLTTDLVEANRNQETDKLNQNKKQVVEVKKLTTSGQNNLRIRKLENTKLIKETPLTISKKINTIEDPSNNIPISTTATKTQKVDLKEKRDFNDIQSFSLQDAACTSSQSTKNKNELDNYKLGPQIGKGSYATVRLATDITTSEQVAIKFYEKYKLFDPQKKKNVQREISILKKISHPNCIGMSKTFENSKHICVVMEYVGKDSLYNYIKTFEGRKLPEDEAKRIFKQIIKGVSYLHTNNIIHRDMKLENLLMDDTKNIKIIDFGFSIMIPPDKKLNIFCGTPSYMAPEIVSKKEYYGPPVDIWACGILLYVMLAGTFPFKAADDKTLYHKIRNCNYELPSHVSAGARQLLKKILNVNYHERATSEEILMDTWISPMNIVRKIDELKAQIKQRQHLLTQPDEEDDENKDL